MIHRRKVQHHQQLKTLRLILVSITIVTLLMCFIVPLQNDFKALEAPKPSSVRVRTILFWNPMFESPDHYFGGLGSHVFKHCAYNNCYTTDNKFHVPQDKFDAIIFHGKEYSEKYFGKPAKRSQNQVYIFSDMEAPVNNPAYMREPVDFYNWTITYRRDSDLPRYYGYYYKKSRNYTMPSRDFVMNKSKKIAWMVSDCKTQSKREDIVKRLSTLIPVDIYGACGNLSCSRSNPKKCYQMLEANYKFYLSFENAICRDYVTEKLFNMLEYDIIPIVYGGVDYAEFAPPKSYIDLLDFKSIDELANYLNFLDKSPEEYLSYFKWKSDYVRGESVPNLVCDLCKKLNEERTFKSYNDIGEWFDGVDGKECWLPKLQDFL